MKMKVTLALVTLLCVSNYCASLTTNTVSCTTGRAIHKLGSTSGTRLWSTSSVETTAVTKDEALFPVKPPMYLAQDNVTLAFPSYYELMNLSPGEFVTSETFFCGSSRFCVKLYPRGGGHGNKNTKSLVNGDKQPSQTGFGMGYDMLPMFGTPAEKVGVYLQYLPDSVDDTVDATFSLRLKGQQTSGPRFDVEWAAGMRFVDLAKTKLANGCANDFGAHLMQTPLLKAFMGVDGEAFLDTKPVTMEVEVIVHSRVKGLVANSDADSDTNMLQSFKKKILKDIRKPLGGNMKVEHDTKNLRVGKIVVPVLKRLSQRPRLFEVGAYPGVEYRILRILDDQGRVHFTSFPGAQYELKPIYPLVRQLERPWPVSVSEKEIPTLYTQDMYNIVSALGSLFAAFSALTSAFIISQAISLFFIPSKSMDPTLEVGDVLLVEKVSARLFPGQQKPGDVVLFQPPSALRDIVSANGGKLTSRDLFVKRVVAKSGDAVAVDGSGNVMVNKQPVPGRRDLCDAPSPQLLKKYIGDGKPEKVLEKKEVFVMGDCSPVSIDSRVWGPLKQTDVVGKPILRIWPLERFGSIQSLPTVEASWSD